MQIQVGNLSIAGFTGKSGLAVTPLFGLVADSPAHALGLTIFRAGRDVASWSLEVLIALTLTDRTQTRPVAGASQVVTLAWARINAGKVLLLLLVILLSFTSIKFTTAPESLPLKPKALIEEQCLKILTSTSLTADRNFPLQIIKTYLENIPSKNQSKEQL